MGKNRVTEGDEIANRRGFLKQVASGTGLLALFGEQASFAQVTARLSHMSWQKQPMRTTQAMAQAGKLFLGSLTAEQRATAAYSFADELRREWHYTPESTKGVSYKQLDPGQRELANGLLRAGLSQQGFLKASTIMSLETLLRMIEKGAGPERDPELYYFAFFGVPQSANAWAWRAEGHHVSLNFTIVGDEHIASTPSFFGANPAEVQHGARKGLRALSAEEDLARTLLKSLDEKQLVDAVISSNAPSDILSGNSRKADPIRPVGLEASRLTGRQAEILMRLLNEYADNMAPEIAAARVSKLHSAGFGNIHFAWAGGAERRQPHYYRIQGPTFLLEYDNIQDDANHIHSVWRDFNNDFGLDLLADHYKKSHS